VKESETFLEKQKNLVIDDVRMNQAKARWAQQLTKTFQTHEYERREEKSLTNVFLINNFS
jgi:hypothetical protein